MDNLGNRIKLLREGKNMTQQALGDIVNLHGSNIGRIEKGKIFPTSDVLLKLSICFGVSCDWLLTGENANTQICDNADENNLLQLYRKLSIQDKRDIQDLIEYKLYKAKKEKEKTSSISETTNNNNLLA